MDILLQLRTRNSIYKNINSNNIFFLEQIKSCQNVALLSIGLWNFHKCKVATQKLDEISIKTNILMKKIRNAGGKIIHGSSTLVNLSKYKPLRDKITCIPEAKLIDHGMISIPPIPIDDSDGGICELNEEYNRKDVVMNIHIEIDYEKDVISGHNKEILNYLKFHNIDLLLVCGTHTNMCVLDRTYGVKNLIRFGLKTVIIRDLVDVVHNPKMAPFTERNETNDIMAEWIEQNICPTIHSEDILFKQNCKKIIYVDIDETICNAVDNNKYENPRPNTINIEKINNLYDNGNLIIYWTARGCVSNKDWLEKTRTQLDKWNVKRHLLKTFKPNYDYFICDKTINITYDLKIENI
jgi:hypothetical protein